MKFITLTGQFRRVSNIKKHLIDWDKPSRSKFQFFVKQHIKQYWFNHIVFEEFPIVGTKLSLDFYNANKKIAIEVQGQQHIKYTPFFHGNYKNNYLAQLDRDKKKLKFCEINDLRLIEIYPNDKLGSFVF